MLRGTRLALLLTCCTTILAGCREPVVTKPPEQLPGTFPVTEISGMLTGWSAGEAFITLVAGYSASVGSNPDSDTLELAPPLYKSNVSTGGAFRIELSAPDESTFIPLGCTAADPKAAFLISIVASAVTTPTTSAEVVGFYNLGDPQGSGKRGAWIYVTDAYKSKATCVVGSQTGLSAVDITLAPGWNQVITSFTESGTVLTSGAIPDSFVWSEYF